MNCKSLFYNIYSTVNIRMLLIRLQFSQTFCYAYEISSNVCYICVLRTGKEGTDAISYWFLTIHTHTNSEHTRKKARNHSSLYVRLLRMACGWRHSYPYPWIIDQQIYLPCINDVLVHIINTCAEHIYVCTVRTIDWSLFFQFESIAYFYLYNRQEERTIQFWNWT